jgi:hypothetical protein
MINSARRTEVQLILGMPWPWMPWPLAMDAMHSIAKKIGTCAQHVDDNDGGGKKVKEEDKRSPSFFGMQSVRQNDRVRAERHYRRPSHLQVARGAAQEEEEEEGR